MRRLGFAVLTMSMAVAACGRIVTVPKSTAGGGTGVTSGNMLIRVRTQGPLDFSNFRYVVVFNTSGNGQEPYAASFTSFANYSFALVFGGTSVTGTSYELLQVIPTQTSQGFQVREYPITPQYVTNYNPNNSGAGNEFIFNFSRLLLLTVPNPLAAATSSPAPAATPTSGAAPTATPLSSPTISPGTSTLWNINVFSTDRSFNPIDGIANLGVQDVSFQFPVNTAQLFDQVVTKPVPAPVQVQSASAQLIQLEVINTP